MEQDGNDYHAWNSSDVEEDRTVEVGAVLVGVVLTSEARHTNTMVDGGRGLGEAAVPHSSEGEDRDLAGGHENVEGASPWEAWVHWDHGTLTCNKTVGLVRSTIKYFPLPVVQMFGHAVFGEPGMIVIYMEIAIMLLEMTHGNLLAVFRCVCPTSLSVISVV